MGFTENGPNNTPMLLVKWLTPDGRPLMDVVPREEANTRIPQTVIKFYEEHIHWNCMVFSDSSEDESWTDKLIKNNNYTNYLSLNSLFDSCWLNLVWLHLLAALFSDFSLVIQLISTVSKKMNWFLSENVDQSSKLSSDREQIAIDCSVHPNDRLARIR